ncbi:hypothetical protein [uncultured Roseibium sp.]|uniref:hypothetical protein n=1 Tax=uncultured Roseibium sp. TaxID=1936171 RepID=UPI0032176D76
MISNLDPEIWEKWKTECSGRHIFKGYASKAAGAEYIALVRADEQRPLDCLAEINDNSVPVHALAIKIQKEVPMYVNISGNSDKGVCEFDFQPKDLPQEFFCNVSLDQVHGTQDGNKFAEVAIPISRDNIKHINDCCITGNIRFAYQEGPNGNRGQSTADVGEYRIHLR